MPSDLSTFNIPQQIFTLFYAIAWGTAANSQPRWKVFAWGAIRHDPPSKRRALLGLVILNFLPLLYFVVVLAMLNAKVWNQTSWSIGAYAKIFVSIIPAFAPFGFYRVWTAIVAKRRELFYQPEHDVATPAEKQRRREIWEQIGITLDVNSELNPRWAAGNLFWGLVYVLVGPISLLLVWGLPYL